MAKTTILPVEIGEPQPAGENAPITVRMSGDHVYVLVDCTATQENLPELVKRLRVRLEELDIGDEPHFKAAVTNLVFALKKQPRLQNCVVLSGTPPTLPQDDRLRWETDFFATGFEMEAATGNVDYRRRAEHRSVQAGQLLATLIAGEPGKDGLDLYGKKIKAKPMHKLNIHAGPNVGLNRKEMTFHAEAAGRITFADRVIRVDDSITIAGDIGLETGNITHTGALIVLGNILPGAEVKTQGDLDIQGNIESANVYCGANLTVTGGIAASKVETRGNLSAKYIEASDVCCTGNIHIVRELIQAEVRSRGAVYVENGRIVGGHIVALQGVKACELGCGACVRTEIIAGLDYALADCIEKKNSEIAAKHKTIESMGGEIARLSARKTLITAKEREQMTLLLCERSVLEDEILSVNQAIAEAKEESAANASMKIEVASTLYPDVICAFGITKLNMTTKLSGPLCLTFAYGMLHVNGKPFYKNATHPPAIKSAP